MVAQLRLVLHANVIQVTLPQLTLVQLVALGVTLKTPLLGDVNLIIVTLPCANSVTPSIRYVYSAKIFFTTIKADVSNNALL